MTSSSTLKYAVSKGSKMEERISRATSKREEYYVIRFDDKEFKIKVVDCQRHHKDYPETQKIEVTQEPNMEDRCRCIELIREINEGHDL